MRKRPGRRSKYGRPIRYTQKRRKSRLMARIFSFILLLLTAIALAWIHPPDPLPRPGLFGPADPFSATDPGGPADQSAGMGQDPSSDPGGQSDGNLTLTVLDVGQGLSLLAESEGRYLLYDGGDREYSSKVVSYLKKQGITHLDYVIASHYDADHLNGVVGALHAFTAGQVFGPGYQADTKIYRSFRQTLEEKDLALTPPSPGQSWEFGSASFTFLAPSGGEYEDANDYSLVVRLECGGQSILLTGDATSVSESEILASGRDLSSDLLIAGHHGSATSTSQEFLDAVSPSGAVISCQYDNPYGHPAQSVMERLEHAGIPVYRTDLQGDLVFHISGNALSCETPPCGDYTPGSAP